MIDLGANPHVKDADDITYYERMIDQLRDSVSIPNNVPSTKSIFFPIKNFQTGQLGEPWYYTTGVYDGKFGRVIGKGGEGVVIQGEFSGRKAAYKFVKIKKSILRIDINMTQEKDYEDSIEEMNEQLHEMTEMMTTSGITILPLEAHFR